jgi:hypothetical protein
MPEEPTVTIESLEVRFDVEGEGDEAAFAKLFEKFIRQWSRQEAEAKARRCAAEAERSLGDRHPEGQN